MSHRSQFPSDACCRTADATRSPGVLSPEMRCVAEREQLPAETIHAEAAPGRMIIPADIHDTALDPIAIGLKARVKINVSIATRRRGREAEPLAEVGCGHGHGPVDGQADRQDAPGMLEAATVPIGTVPIHRASSVEDLTAELLLETIERQARKGVDHMTIHAGVRLEHLSLCRHRTTGIVSRGGGLLARWMVHHKRENPLYERFDDVVEVCRRHDVSISLKMACDPAPSPMPQTPRSSPSSRRWAS